MKTLTNTELVELANEISSVKHRFSKFDFDMKIETLDRLKALCISAEIDTTKQSLIIIDIKGILCSLNAEVARLYELLNITQSETPK